MALRDKLAANSYPYLEPGEQIHHIFSAQTGPNPMFSALTWLISFWIKVYIVVVTDRAIVLLSASMWRPTKPRGIYKRVTRHIVLGPVSGLWGKMNIEGERFWVHKRFHKDVLAADMQLGQLGAGQPQQQWQHPQSPQQPGAQLG